MQREYIPLKQTVIYIGVHNYEYGYLKPCTCEDVLYISYNFNYIATGSAWGGRYG